MLNFGDRLTEERKRLGLNQTDFGAVGGVTKTSQVNYESGMRSPDAKYWQAIAEIGADVNYILTGVRVNPIVKSEVLKAKELIDEIGGLTAASSERRLKRLLAESEDEGTMLKVDAVNEDVVSPKKRELMRLLERLDENALDDAIYSTKKLVENCEMKMMLQKLTAQQGQQQRMTA